MMLIHIKYTTDFDSFKMLFPGQIFNISIFIYKFNIAIKQKIYENVIHVELQQIEQSTLSLKPISSTGAPSWE